MSARQESDLIQALARRFLGASQDEDVLAYLRQPIDWVYLEEISSMEGMGGLLATQLHGLARSHALDLPLGDLSKLLRDVFACNGGLVAELSSLRTVLEQHGIQVIVLKGGALISTVYRRQLGMRPLSDIDLLIKASDLDLIQQALQQRGFRSIFPSGTFLTNGPVAFDLHLDLVGSARIRRRAEAFRFDPNELWKKALPLDGVDESLLVLSPTHQFLHLSVHGQKHSFSRLIWLVDLALVCRQVSWGELIEEARRTGTLRPVAYALSSIAGLFGTKVPQDVWGALPRLNWIERRFVTAVVGRRAAEPEGELLVAFSIPSLLGKLSYLLEFAFPRPHVLAEVFPTTPAVWFYPRRAGEILAQGAAQVLRVVRQAGRLEIPKAGVKRPGENQQRKTSHLGAACGCQPSRYSSPHDGDAGATTL